MYLTDAAGHRQAVRNGHLRTRCILTGVGAIKVATPRVHDHREPGQREKFVSKLLLPYLRKAKNLEERIAWLYLKDISTGDMGEAFRARLGPDAAGLSAPPSGGSRTSGEGEFKTWRSRSLAGNEYVYQCLLLISS